MAREKNIYITKCYNIPCRTNYLQMIWQQTHNTCNEKIWRSIYFPDTEIFRYLETKQHSWLFMSFINKNRKTEKPNKTYIQRSVWHLQTEMRGLFLRWSVAKKKSKKRLQRGLSVSPEEVWSRETGLFCRKKNWRRPPSPVPYKAVFLPG